uniref:Porin family protein n=1 Tax=Prevotella sp. GTC17253 TaxID=3236793 RepID=A0AB33IWS8_9BACT
MKRLMLILALATLFVATQAQSRQGTFSLIPKVGITLANMTNMNLSTDDGELETGFKAGFVGGVQTEYQLTPKLSVSLAALYSMQGCRYADYHIKAPMQVTEDKEYLGLHNHHVNLDYVSVPLMLNYYVIRGLAVKVGVQWVGLVNAKESKEETPYKVNKAGAYTYGEMKQTKADLMEKYEKTEFSIPLGVSYEYMNVVVEARYNLGLSRITQTEKSRNRCFTITAGYKFDL